MTTAEAAAILDSAKRRDRESAIAARDARIAELESALRELVEDVEDGPGASAAFVRTNCPECDEDPEEAILLCPLHKAKATLTRQRVTR